VATYRRVKRSEEEYSAATKRREANRTRSLSTEASLPAVYRRAAASNGPLSPADVRVLERSVGNRTTVQVLSERAGEQTPVVQRSLDEEDPACPGGKIRSEGQGKGLGFGQGEGPIAGREKEEGE
jgi:hypothetical protein